MLRSSWNTAAKWHQHDGPTDWPANLQCIFQKWKVRFQYCPTHLWGQVSKSCCLLIVSIFPFQIYIYIKFEECVGFFICNFCRIGILFPGRSHLLNSRDARNYLLNTGNYLLNTGNHLRNISNNLLNTRNYFPNSGNYVQKTRNHLLNTRNHLLNKYIGYVETFFQVK